jgi:hypothetical protein
MLEDLLHGEGFLPYGEKISHRVGRCVYGDGALVTLFLLKIGKV